MRKKYTKDGHKEICYKCIDYSIVGVYEFKNTGINLLIFSGKYIGHTISTKNQTDFVNYGIMRELMGRFSKYVSMNPLTKEDIKKILLQLNFSPLNTYKLLFESMNIDFSYDDSFVDYIAEEAISLNSGARSLKTVFDNTIGSAMFRIFAGEYSAIHLTRDYDTE